MDSNIFFAILSLIVIDFVSIVFFLGMHTGKHKEVLKNLQELKFEIMQIRNDLKFTNKEISDIDTKVYQQEAIIREIKRT